MLEHRPNIKRIVLFTILAVGIVFLVVNYSEVLFGSGKDDEESIRLLEKDEILRCGEFYSGNISEQSIRFGAYSCRLKINSSSAEFLPYDAYFGNTQEAIIMTASDGGLNCVCKYGQKNFLARGKFYGEISETTFLCSLMTITANNARARGEDIDVFYVKFCN